MSVTPESQIESLKSVGLQKPVHRTFGLSQVDENDKCVEFCWLVKNFNKTSSDSILSPIFDGGELSKVKWLLILCPKDRCLFDGKDYIGITISLVEGQNFEADGGLNAYFEFKLHLDGITKEYKAEKHTFSCNKESLLCKRIMESPAAGSVENDVIKIECKITLRPTESKFTRKIIGSTEYQNSDEDHFEKLRDDFLKILQNNEHSDFEIKVQDETFKVHKVILSARSEVFSTMLSIPMQETTNSSVKIEDFDKKIVENMLEYIYTGKTGIYKSNVQELLKIAEKYDLQNLKSDCEKYIIAFLLNNENCVEFLELADTFNASKLKAAAINFIIKFKNEVCQTEHFQNLVNSNGPLAVEVLIAEWQNGGIKIKMKTSTPSVICPKISKKKKNCTSCTVA